MQIEKQTAKLRILTPDEDHWLTNGEVFSKQVILGVEASADD